jgi:hypothetical protein
MGPFKYYSGKEYSTFYRNVNMYVMNYVMLRDVTSQKTAISIPTAVRTNMLQESHEHCVCRTSKVSVINMDDTLCKELTNFRTVFRPLCMS